MKEQIKKKTSVSAASNVSTCVQVNILLLNISQKKTPRAVHKYQETTTAIYGGGLELQLYSASYTDGNSAMRRVCALSWVHGIMASTLVDPFLIKTVVCFFSDRATVFFHAEQTIALMQSCGRNLANSILQNCVNSCDLCVSKLVQLPVQRSPYQFPAVNRFWEIYGVTSMNRAWSII